MKKNKAIKKSKIESRKSNARKAAKPETRNPKPETYQDVGASKRVPLTAIAVARNVRREFNLDELLQSIREQGIIQPLLVRPRPNYEIQPPDFFSKNFRVAGREFEDEKAAQKFLDGIADRDCEYELVAGGRRYQCASQLKLKDVPVLVRPMTDAQAREIQLIENLQREELSAIDEAQGYQDAIDHKDYGENWTKSVAAMAERLGKSKSHISNRLSLLKLGEGARSALSRGELDLTIAVLVASIPGAVAQQQAIAHIRKPNEWNDDVMTFKEAREYIEETFRRSLNKPPFDVEDAELYPEAGVCGKCPFRVAPNVCTNTPCYEEKTRRTINARAAAYQAKGRVVVEKKPEELFYGGHRNGAAPSHPSLKHGTGYIQATDTCYQDPKHRSYKELLGKHAPPAVALDQVGHAVEVYPEKGLVEALKGAGHKFLEQKQADNLKEREKEAFTTAVNREMFKDMLHLVETDLKKNLRPLLVTVLAAEIARGRMRMVFKRRGEEDVETDEKWYRDHTDSQLASYLLELILIDYDGEFHDAPEVAEEFGLKPHLIEDRVKVRLKAEANAKKA